MDATATEATEQVLTPSREEKFRKIIEAHGATITSQEYNIPDTYDFSGFPEKDRQMLEGIVDGLENFLSLPIISDSCENHEQRRIIKREIVESVPKEERILIDEFLERNKMRRGCLSTLLLADFLPKIDNLPQEELGEHVDQLHSLIRTITRQVSQDDIVRIIKHAKEDGHNDIAEALSHLPQSAGPQDVVPLISGLLRDPQTRGRYAYKTIDPWEGPTTPDKIKTVEEISGHVVKILDCLGNLKGTNIKNSHV